MKEKKKQSTKSTFNSRKYLIPDSNDEIRQEQMREMELISVGTGDPITGMAAGA